MLLVISQDSREPRYSKCHTYDISLSSSLFCCLFLFFLFVRTCKWISRCFVDEREISLGTCVMELVGEDDSSLKADGQSVGLVSDEIHRSHFYSKLSLQTGTA